MSKKFFDVVINKADHTYYITESSQKPQLHGSALDTMKKIEQIVLGDFSRVNNPSLQEPDPYSKYEGKEAYLVLKEKSMMILEGYIQKEKESLLYWILPRFFFPEEKELQAIETRIVKHVDSLQNVVLPDIMGEIAKYLDPKTKAAFARVSQHGKTGAEQSHLAEAKKFGYEGENAQNAAKYTQELFAEVTEMVQKEMIPKSACAYKNSRLLFKGQVDPEQTLKNLRELSTKELFTLLSKALGGISHLGKVFGVEENWGSERTAATDQESKEIGGRALAEAERSKNFKTVELLLKYGADVNGRDRDGRTALMLAAKEVNLERVKFLMDRGSDINLKTSDNFNALSYLYKSKYYRWNDDGPEIQRLLLEAKPDLSIIKEIVRELVVMGNRKLAEELIETHHLNRKEVLDSTDRYGHTPLVNALSVTPLDFNKVQYLIENGADPNAKDHWGDTIILIAARTHPEVVEYLIEKGADTNDVNKQGSSLLSVMKRGPMANEAIIEFLELKEKQKNSG